MKDYKWWQSGVIYQIYPRSFFDSNNDGIGDINGIIQKLDYLQWLGIEAIWLSPINKSPMYDFGYDISDYYDIDPSYGTMEDFDRLIEEAHKRNIKIIMDLVVNHTSHLHKWFIKSRSSPDNDKRNWYIWRKGKNGAPPNNWKSAFGGSAWELDSETGEYYLHSFLKEQPDLNWRNNDMRNAIYKMVRFWLDKGVAGFRLDVVNWFVKDEKFRDNPWTIRPLNPERHKYDRNRPEVHQYLKELRNVIDEYDNRMTVGEVFTLPPGDPELSASFLGNGHDELHMAFDFSIMYRLWSARQFYTCIKKWYKALHPEGWPCNVLSNHDQPRSRTRFLGGSDSEKRARVAAVFLLTIKGTPFIYYGEELGMTNTRLRRSEIVDPLGKRYWPVYSGRDCSRTPMLWNSKENAGFSETRPWLPVDSNYKKINVKSQMKDRYSILNLYRNLIHLRKKHKALAVGEISAAIKGFNGSLAYFRFYEDEKFFIALNFSKKEKKIHINERGQWRVMLSTHRSNREHLTNLSLTLAPYEATVIMKIGEL
ncbi:MAG TPA: alpha-glucosidase [Spirochaetota bacterium]|nr:alpha-glucosidase [Spirochaetota bacterium]HRU66450.1 alpha-glucosidase [Spirochaetota bacterium]